MRAEGQIFSGGFADPVLAGQAVFKALMHGMANPARIDCVPDATGARAEAPAAMTGIALTLLDHDTTVWLSPALERSTFPQWLAFHTGAPVIVDRMAADFVLAAAKDDFPALADFPLGSDTYPDRSATLVVEVEALSGGELLVARGPGIRDSVELSPRGLPDSFLRDWSLNQGLYPRGLDLILVCRTEFLCLPRTTRLTKREA